tara:strand:- start:23 stop:367 length:345 start_codon:yes stop_codon:yes gene_type:complete
MNKIDKEPNNEILLHFLEELLNSFTRNQLKQIQNIETIINNNPEYFKYFNEFKKIKTDYLGILNIRNFIIFSDNQTIDYLGFNIYRNLIQKNIEIFLNKKTQLKEKLNKQYSKL